MSKRCKVLHIITRLIIGGAQENTMLSADYLTHDRRYQGQYEVSVLSGTQTGPEGSIIDEVRQRGVSLILLPELVRELNPYKDVMALLKIRQLLIDSQGKPNFAIVHTHSSKAGILGRIAARWARVPIIVHTVHGWSFHDHMAVPKKYLYVFLEKLTARLSDGLIAVTTRDIDKGLEYGIGTADQYTIIRSGIELERFGHPRVLPQQMKKQLGIPPQAPVVGSVTRLSPQKAPLDLVNAFARVQQAHPNTWFVIVGDGPQRPEIERCLQETGLKNRTVLTGLRRDIPELLAIFDIFVLSSLWEGLPRVLLQAMASGLPVVCTRVDGSTEVVSENQNGFLVPPGQSDALADKISLLLSDRQLRNRMGKHGPERVVNFSAQRMIHDLHELYQRLLENKLNSWPGVPAR